MAKEKKDGYSATTRRARVTKGKLWGGEDRIDRTCLKCGHKFKAIGKVNRICRPCTNDNTRKYS
jgi:hypothetical protein